MYQVGHFANYPQATGSFDKSFVDSLSNYWGISCCLMWETLLGTVSSARVPFNVMLFLFATWRSQFCWFAAVAELLLSIASTLSMAVFIFTELFDNVPRRRFQKKYYACEIAIEGDGAKRLVRRQLVDSGRQRSECSRSSKSNASRLASHMTLAFLDDGEPVLMYSTSELSCRIFN